MAWSSAAWVLGGVRLISSARTTLAKTGPWTKRNARRPVVRSSSMISVPVMSLGIRSGVNWTRLNERFSASATVCTISVLASPGTPDRAARAPREDRREDAVHDLLLADDAPGDLGAEIPDGLGQSGQLLNFRVGIYWVAMKSGVGSRESGVRSQESGVGSQGSGVGGSGPRRPDVLLPCLAVV